MCRTRAWEPRGRGTPITGVRRRHRRRTSGSGSGHGVDDRRWPRWASGERQLGPGAGYWLRAQTSDALLGRVHTNHAIREGLAVAPHRHHEGTREVWGPAVAVGEGREGGVSSTVWMGAGRARDHECVSVRITLGRKRATCLAHSRHPPHWGMRWYTPGRGRARVRTQWAPETTGGSGGARSGRRRLVASTRAKRLCMRTLPGPVTGACECEVLGVHQATAQGPIGKKWRNYVRIVSISTGLNVTRVGHQCFAKNFHRQLRHEVGALHVEDGHLLYITCQFIQRSANILFAPE